MKAIPIWDTFCIISNVSSFFLSKAYCISHLQLCKLFLQKIIIDDFLFFVKTCGEQIMVSLNFLVQWIKKNVFILIITIGVVVNIQLILRMLEKGCERNQIVEISDTLTIDKSSILLQKLGKQLQV